MAKHQTVSVIILAVLALGICHNKNLLAAEFDPAHPEWLFDEKWNPEGWRYHNDINIINVDEGTMKMETTGNDPWIFCGIGKTPLKWENQPAYLNVDAGEHPTLYARMALSPSNNMIEFYYTTEEDPHWSGRQERRWQNLKPSGEMEEYEFDMGWQGTITGLRMDFAEVPGVEIEIDYLSFVGHPEPSEVVQPGDPEWNPPEHRIGIRVVEGVGEFYDRVTGKKFIPRGNNYICLAEQQTFSGELYVDDSTFNTNIYDSVRMAQTLREMSQNGYNVIRAFLNSDSTTGISAGRGSYHGLSSDYLSNIADFLNHAGANGIYVMFTQDWLPSGKYGELIGRNCCEVFDCANVNYLSEWGLKANQLFFQDFIEGLIKHDAPLDAVFAYELRNELYFDSDEPPLSLHSGLVTTANGKTYDMAVSEDKKRMMDEGLVYWIDEVREAILEVTPDALVAVGFFVPQGPNPMRIGDPRLIETYPAIWESSADFIDLHAYPGWDSLAQLVENFKINGMQSKPIIMGEFGAFKKDYSSAEMAGQALQDWQIESCGYGFDGWLLWTWESDELPHFGADNEEINRVLAPVYRPDPCAPSMPTRRNVALGKPATASSFLPDQRPEMAVDGVARTEWISGDDAPQWLEIDLGTSTDIGEIVLLVAGNPEVAGHPEGEHRVWGRGPNENYRLLVELSEFTAAEDGNWLYYSHTPIIAWKGIQFVKIETVVCSVWPMWGEIMVFSAEASVEHPWDVNRDGKVDVWDIGLVAQYMGRDVTAPSYPNPDVNDDGAVDILDIILVAKHFGEAYSPAEASANMRRRDEDGNSRIGLTGSE